MAGKTTSFTYNLGGGQFAPKKGGQFVPERGGQFAPEKGGQCLVLKKPYTFCE